MHLCRALSAEGSRARHRTPLCSSGRSSKHPLDRLPSRLPIHPHAFLPFSSLPCATLALRLLAPFTSSPGYPRSEVYDAVCAHPTCSRPQAPDSPLVSSIASLPYPTSHAYPILAVAPLASCRWLEVMRCTRWLVLAAILAAAAVRATVTGDFTAEQQSNTLAVLQAFAGAIPELQSTWSGSDFCSWGGVTCAVSSVRVAGINAMYAGTLPEMPAGVDYTNVMITRLDFSTMARGLSGTLPDSECDRRTLARSSPLHASSWCSSRRMRGRPPTGGKWESCATFLCASFLLTVARHSAGRRGRRRGGEAVVFCSFLPSASAIVIAPASTALELPLCLRRGPSVPVAPSLSLALLPLSTSPEHAPLPIRPPSCLCSPLPLVVPLFSALLTESHLGLLCEVLVGFLVTCRGPRKAGRAVPPWCLVRTVRYCEESFWKASRKEVSAT
ncbi:surface antigen protein, putative [Leishmania panamensis]|uniref:surface antigen protein, putative n=1 Tax=Leishmania panamensis TaxID=5679 RepID=UPI0004F6D8EA|nr:surface antigen protein, putative [Leishmania panamensis]AIN96404.1 surface antigen protein, putative [Leishmania panamensis]